MENILDKGIETKSLHNGYKGKAYTLLELRKTANEYKADNPNIDLIKKKHKKVYNCLKENVPHYLLSEVYGLKEDYAEIWLPVKIATKLPYCVSSLGRIAIDLGNNKRKILLQADMRDEKTGLLKKGYLAISYENDELVEGKLNHSTCVYNFVGWTFYPESIRENLDIHHINNNGYDCRPDNLIPLTPREHSKAHGFFVSTDTKRNIEE